MNSEDIKEKIEDHEQRLRQGSVDFTAIKNAGIEVVYIKATEGLTYNDSTFKTFYNNAKAVGLKVGFYHFLRNNDLVQETIHFLNCISGYTYDCIPMIDVEDASIQNSNAVSRVQTFANYCKSQGVAIGLYT